jgi:hypothetical protein
LSFKIFAIQNFCHSKFYQPNLCHPNFCHSKFYQPKLLQTKNFYHPRSFTNPKFLPPIIIHQRQNNKNITKKQRIYKYPICVLTLKFPRTKSVTQSTQNKFPTTQNVTPNKIKWIIIKFRCMQNLPQTQIQ